MIFFLDSSALVKRYVEEPGSLRVRELFRRRRSIAVSRITYAEVSAAAARRRREGALDAPVHERLLERFHADFRAFIVVELRQPTVALAAQLCGRHPLRAYDAVQLASAVSLREAGTPIDFWATDERLTIAAQAEGLRSTRLR